MSGEQLELGRDLRDQGMSLVDEATEQAWKERADEAIAWLARTGRIFTAEDVRRYAGDPPRENAMGARLHANAKAGVIQRVGYRQATRASRHAAVLAEWRGT